MIAVSGASGFLGSYVVCTLLEKGNTIRAFRRNTSAMDEFDAIFRYYFREFSDLQREQLRKHLHWVVADINDLPSLDEALTEVDEVYHCAAMVSFVQKDQDAMMECNVEGTANMVNISLLKGVKKFCHVSSIAALGRVKSGDSITEATRWNNSKHNSNYAISKYKAEMEVWRAAEEGLNVVIVNPGVILGVGDWTKGSCKLFQLVWKGMPFYTEGINGYVDVRDVAKAMVLLTEQSVFGERFVLVGKNVNMHWFLDTVATLLGKKRPSIQVNKLLSQLAWMADGIKSRFTGKKPSLTKETARASMNQFYYSAAKIEQTINFAFTPMEQTIQEACTQFLKTHSPNN
ncbi:MAG: NAD-dependent epimerase/dehydratase family protein [Bacteroidota bacterium]